MASAAPAPDYLVLGHLCLDQTPSILPEGHRDSVRDGPPTPPDPSEPAAEAASAINQRVEVLGGTAAYAALTARALGRRPAIVTSAGDDLDLAPLAGTPIERVPAAHSTTFRNEYTGNARRQHLLARAATLETTSVPAEWRGASIVHLAPIAGELAPSLPSLFVGNELVGLTPQGWMRTWDDTGLIRPAAWTPALSSIERVDVVIIGVEDVGGDEAELARLASVCRLLVATEGPLGARVYWNHDVRRLAAPPADPIDPTGAGDIFAAAFFIRYQQTRDPWEAARFANRLASTSVTRQGLAGVPTAAEAEQAAQVWTR
jgi:sugar/nucleoside kinase (ribokinase family)